MTRQVITPRFVLRPQRRTPTRCDTASTMTLRRDASPASPGRRPAIAGSSTSPSALHVSSDDRTPREAIKTPEGLEQVKFLLHTYEHGEVQQGPGSTSPTGVL